MDWFSISLLNGKEPALQRPLVDGTKEPCPSSLVSWEGLLELSRVARVPVGHGRLSERAEGGPRSAALLPIRNLLMRVAVVQRSTILVLFADHDDGGVVARARTGAGAAPRHTCWGWCRHRSAADRNQRVGTLQGGG